MEKAQKKKRGPKSGESSKKLTLAQVIEIRERYSKKHVTGISLRKLSQEFGVSFQMIHHIVKNRQWTVQDMLAIPSRPFKEPIYPEPVKHVTVQAIDDVPFVEEEEAVDPWGI